MSLIPTIPKNAPVPVSFRGQPRIAVVTKIQFGPKMLEPGWMGWLGLTKVTVRVAEAWEMSMPEAVFERAAPLVDRMAMKTISRRKYRLLRALIVEVAMETGQVDAADGVLLAMERQWRKCPLRYIWV
jgi:hypothetical protein